MADVNSKNMYALLGNTSDQDSDREPEPPTKAIDGPAARSGKRNAPKEAPAAPAAGAARGGRRGNFTGSEQAYRDKEAGRTTNRGKPIDDGVREDRHRNTRGQARGEGRGGRGGAGGRRGKDDRQNRTGQSEHVKQADAAWGGPTGAAELADEQAGAAIAQAEEKTAVAEGEWNAAAAAGAPGWDEKAPQADAAEVTKENEAEAEPEDNHISYAEYLASKTRDISLGVLEARKPNEAPTKTDKKFANAKELPRADDEDYIPASEAKAARQRERKAKALLDIDYAFKEQPREGGARGGRGGRGGDRGDRPRGPPRGSFRGGEAGEGRGEGRPRGAGRGRGEGRGGRGFEGRGSRGGPRGGGPSGPSVDDKTAFPSLGGK